MLGPIDLEDWADEDDLVRAEFAFCLLYTGLHLIPALCGYFLEMKFPEDCALSLKGGN
jgi:hypothetical protein